MTRADGARVHASAIVEDGADLAAGVVVGPLCHVGPHVTLGEGVELKAQCSVQGRTTIGAGTRIWPFASIGSEPQDLKYAGEDVFLDIGENCMIREGVTMNPGTGAHRGRTSIGNRSVFLANAHVAHDCVVGDNVIFSNNVMLAGHCTVGNHVIFPAHQHHFLRR